MRDEWDGRSVQRLELYKVFHCCLHSFVARTHLTPCHAIALAVAIG